jgi:ABC-type branched-subunit amino acid transport system substrate-binding protein
VRYNLEVFGKEEKERVKAKILFISLAVVLALSLGLIGCTGEVTPEVPDNIEILAVRSVSGPLSVYEQVAMGPVWRYWEHVVNNVTGGIHVPEFDETLPIHIELKDDSSDMETMQTLMDTSLATGKYDFVIGPCCTPFLQAAGSICTLHGAVLVGAEGGATSVAEQMQNYPYMFSNLGFSNWYQMPILCEILDSWAANETDGEVDVFVISMSDLFGVEYSGQFQDYAAGYTTIDILDIVDTEPHTEDVGAQVEAAAAAGADFLLLNCYPPTMHAAVGYAIEHNIDFKGIVTGPGACYEQWYDTYFGPCAEGICGYGAWNEYSSIELRAFTEGMIDFLGARTAMDWWGGAYYYVGLDMLTQAIADADEYSALSVRNVMASEKLDTILGETYYTTYNGTWPIGFSGGLLALACHPGEIGQWQRVTEANDWRPDGDTTSPARLKPYGIPEEATEWAIFEVIDPNDNATTPISIYPKPTWEDLGCYPPPP